MEKQTGKDRRMTGNKKRIVCGALLCVMALGMTACGNEIPDLTEAESQRVGEYAAVTLLKYDANHRSPHSGRRQGKYPKVATGSSA